MMTIIMNVIFLIIQFGLMFLLFRELLRLLFGHKEKRSNGKSESLQQLFDFFTDYHNGATEHKKNVFAHEHFYNGTVHVYVRDFKDDIKEILFYIKCERMLTIHYQFGEGDTFEYTDHFDVLQEKDEELLARFLRLFLHAVYQIPARDYFSFYSETKWMKKPTALIDSTEGEPTLPKKDWTSYVPLIQDQEILDELAELERLAQTVQRQKESFDTVEWHRFERLEETVLPNTLVAFCAFSQEEQKLHKRELVVALTNAKATLIELTQKEKKEKEHVFKKNIELLKRL